MNVFNTHGKIYEASAEQMFHLPYGSVKKGDPMRQKGKIAELALGFGGSVGALKAMGALNMGLEENELKPLVKRWRTANPAITKFWWDTDAAVRRTITTKAPSKLPFGMGLYKDGPLLRLMLPNGRTLRIAAPDNSKVRCCKCSCFWSVKAFSCSDNKAPKRGEIHVGELAV